MPIQSLFDQRRIHVKRARLDVDKHRPGSSMNDVSGGGKERVGNSQHFIARTHSERPQSEQDRIRTRGASNAVAGIAIGRNFSFQPGYRFAQNKSLIVADTSDFGGNFFADRGVLGLEVEQYDGFHACGRGVKRYVFRIVHQSHGHLVLVRCATLSPFASGG